MLSRFRNVLSADEVVAVMRSGLAPQIVDCSWHMPNSGRSGRKEFEQGKRIPSAVFFDLDEAVPEDTDLPHMMPSGAMLAEYLSKKGISMEKPTVVYDNSSTGIFSSPRLWYMLKSAGMKNVAVLDGGLKRWQALGLEIDTSPKKSCDLASVSVTNPTATVRPSAFVSAAEVLRLIDNVSDKVLIDARSAGRFTGAEPEPRPGLRRGHIPKFLNVPFSALLDKDKGTFLSKESLAQVFASAGVDVASVASAEQLAFSCGSGVTACVPLLALVEYFGVDERRCSVYDGAFAEWGKLEYDPRYPVTCGP